MLHGGTVYVDHSSGLVFIWNQVSLRANETIVGKQAFEQMAEDYDVKIKRHYFIIILSSLCLTLSFHFI